MKLARPDIRHPRIVLAGSVRTATTPAWWPRCAARPARALAGLGRPGHAGRRSGDPAGRAATERDEFSGVDQAVPNLLNAPDVVAWNTGRRHLRDLRRARVCRCCETVGPSGAAARTRAGVSRRHRSHTHSPRTRRSRPISNCGTSARPPCRRPPTTLGIGSRAALRPRRRDRRARRRRAGGAGSGRARRWAGGCWTTTPATTPNVSSRWASSQLWTGWGSARSRIEAHSAAVAAVHIAAPATWTATSAAGTPVKNCTVPTAAWPNTSHQQDAQPQQHRPRRVHRQQPEAEPDQQRQVGDQQRRVHVHQRGDLDPQPRHGPVGLRVAGVRTRRGDQRAGHQHRGQGHRAERGEPRSGLTTRCVDHRRRRARRS